MNKKTIIMVLLILILIGGIYYSVNKVENSDNGNMSQTDIEDNMGGIDKEEEITQDGEEYFHDIKVGEPAPDFTLKDLDGNEVSLSDYIGKTVIINFWQTTCPYCKIEMPDLEKIYKENDKDVVVLAVSVAENEKTVRPFIDDGGYTFPVLLDEKGEVATIYLVGGFPTSYFIDKDGILLGGVPGMMNYQQLTGIINDIEGSE